MTITINGSGSITGISAGGLPDAIITTAEVVDANITPAKLAQKLTSGTAVASTSGTSIDFTSIPSWVKRITVMLNAISTNGTSVLQVQIGSGSVQTTGYNGSASYGGAGGNQAVVINSGIPLVTSGMYGNATIVVAGAITMTLVTGNTWVVTGAVGNLSSAVGTVAIAGNAVISGVLDRIRITTVNGTDTFDAGSINILYEG